MTTEKTTWGIRIAKWAWLLYLASSFPLAMLFLTQDESRVGLIPMSRIGVFALAAGFVVFWIATQALLGVYRFPQAPPLIARLLAGQVIQAGVVFWAGRSLSLVLLTLFMTILTALTLVVLALAGWKFLKAPRGWFRIVVFILFAALCGLFYQIFFGPLRIGLKGLEALPLIVTVAVMAANVISTASILYHFPLNVPPVRLGVDYDRIWQRWAPPTLILLIAASIAAAVIADSRGIQ